MKFLSILVLALSLVGVSTQAQEKKAVITLTKRNTLVLRNVIDDMSVAQVQEQAMKMSQQLSPGETINLVLDTPGGSIEAGAKLISTLQALPQRVNTISVFAASMGFITAESLGTRYVTPEGILMSHRAAGGTQGQIPGELNTRVKFFTHMVNKTSAKVAKRVGLSPEAYAKLIHDEYWVQGDDAVADKMADRVVFVRCDKELSEGRSTETLQTFFGPIGLVYSTCPVVSAPLEIKFEGLNLREWDESDKAKLIEIRKAVLSLTTNKEEYYHEYILTNKYKQLFP